MAAALGGEKVSLGRPGLKWGESGSQERFDNDQKQGRCAEKRAPLQAGCVCELDLKVVTETVFKTEKDGLEIEDAYAARSQRRNASPRAMASKEQEWEHCVNDVAIHVEGCAHHKKEGNPEQGVLLELVACPWIETQSDKEQGAAYVPIDNRLTQHSVVGDKRSAQMKDYLGQIIVCCSDGAPTDPAGGVVQGRQIAKDRESTKQEDWRKS